MDPITLTLDLNIDQFLRRHLGYDEEGEENSAQMTMEDVVIDAAARNLTAAAVAQVAKDEWAGFKGRIKAIRDEEIAARLVPLIDEAMTAPIQRTNGYGEPSGAGTTLRDEIVKQATDYLNKPGDGYSRDKGTFVQQFIRAEVAKAVQAELKDALDAAKAEVAAAVKSNAASMIQQTISQLAGVR